MSGALPETERERQLRRLASHLLTWPDLKGPVSVDLIPVGYPDDLPPELVDRTEFRFIGCLVRRREGALIGADLVFDGPGEPDAVVATYEASLVRLGWKRLSKRELGGGFEKLGVGAWTLLANKTKSAVVFLDALLREDGSSRLRVRYDAEDALDMIAKVGRGLAPEGSILPRLKPPPGVKFLGEDTGDGAMWKSDGRAQTEMAPMELEAYFAKQLEEAGWGRMTGSADEAFAWSSWLIPDSGRWRGVLLVLAALPGWRYVTVRAEIIEPGGH